MVVIISSIQEAVAYLFSSLWQRNKIASVSFWSAETGVILSTLLQYASYPADLRIEIMSFYSSFITPHLGPSPSELASKRLKPLSYMGDDHSPLEYGWVVKGDGKSSVQFSIEPLDKLDGSPLSPQENVKVLRSLGSSKCVKSFDMTWPNICKETLAVSQVVDVENNFFLGAELTRTGVVGKAYYLPGPRARADKCSVESTIDRCMTALDLTTPWRQVASYIESQSSRRGKLIADIVAVDCVAPSKNRAKIYARTLDKTFTAIEQHITLGGKLNDDVSVRGTVEMLRTLWSVFFPGIGEHEPLPVQHPNMGDWPGFLLYYELTLGSDLPFPKVYIPVRQFCPSDKFIAEGICKYLVKRNLPFGTDYVNKVQQLFPHRKLGSRTGIHTYIACCSRPTGPQLYIYLSPEVFACERV